MATYNGADYIEEQLFSFINQKRQPDELVITDDCSTDRTAEIVREFSEKASFDVFFSVNDKNLGYTGNFNQALSKTTGDIVFLSDQDDVWFPEKISTVIKAAADNPEILLLMNDADLTDEKLNRIGLTKIDQIRSLGPLESGFVMGCCCAVRKELLTICLPIPEGIKGHDNWVVGFATRMDRRLILPQVLQFYRRHDNNESDYIANSTKKINKLTALISEIRTVKGIKDESYIDSLNQSKAMRDVVTVQLIDGGIFNHDLEKMKLSLSKKIMLMERRVNIRKLPFLRRVFSAFIYAIEGGYSGAGGAKKFVRDCYG